MKFGFIDEHRKEYPVQMMCRVLGVSRSGYYAWRKRPLSRRKQEDQWLLVQVEAIHREGRGHYGSVKIHKVLRQRGIRCSRKRVTRLRQEAGLRSRSSRVFKRTTRTDPTAPVAPNRLEQKFEASVPNQIWLADITYVWTLEGWLYLAVIMDLFSRRIVGWAMGRRITAMLTQNALGMALQRRRPLPEQLLHHSDRGSQYTSRSYQADLARAGITVSMSGTGNCYDNAPMESFFALLKTELVYHERYRTRQEAKSSIFEYIECFYNRQRVHGSLGYVTPVQFERNWLQTTFFKIEEPVGLASLTNMR